MQPETNTPTWSSASAQMDAIRTNYAVMEFDLDGNLTTANDRLLQMFGYSLDEVRGRHHRIFVDSDDADSADYRAFWEQLRIGEPLFGEFRRVHKDGRAMWLQASYTPVLGEDGRPTRVLVLATDISDSKRRTDDLESQFAAIDRSQIIIEFDLQGTIRRVNRNFCLATGCSPHEVHGQSYLSLLAECNEDVETFWSDLRRGKYRSGRFQLTGFGDRELWLQATFNPVFDAEGSPVKIVAYATDVTVQNQRDLALTDEAGRAKTTFLANMSHEVRTPLTAILGYTQVLLDEAQSQGPLPQCDELQAIKRNADLLLATINGVLEMSAVEAGELSVEMQPTCPAEVIDEVVAATGTEARAKGLEIKVEIDNEIPERISSDPEILRKILLHLVGNAIKFTDAGSVTIRAEEPRDGQLKLVISDTGIGLTPEQCRNVIEFAPFWQGDSSMSRRFTGAGLGLPISNSLARMLGGQVTVESELGCGSTFTALLPTGTLTETPSREQLEGRTLPVAYSYAPLDTDRSIRFQDDRAITLPAAVACH